MRWGEKQVVGWSSLLMLRSDARTKSLLFILVDTLGRAAPME